MNRFFQNQKAEGRLKTEPSMSRSAFFESLEDRVLMSATAMIDDAVSRTDDTADPTATVVQDDRETSDTTPTFRLVDTNDASSGVAVGGWGNDLMNADDVN